MRAGTVDVTRAVGASAMTVARLAICAGALGLFAANGAMAATCRGIDFPDRIRLEGATLDINGLGVRKATFLRINVYVAALYLPRGTVANGAWPVRDAQALIEWPGPAELVLRFVRGVGVGEIRKAFAEGFAAQAGGRPPPALADRVRTFDGWMKPVRSGESMTLARVPGRGIELDLGGHREGIIPGEDFAAALFRIWLGDPPPNPELKAGLLGGPCG